MRKLVAALIAIVGLVMLAGSVSLLMAPISVLFMEMPLWQSAAAIVLSLLPAAASIALAAYLIRARERIAVWYLPEDDVVPAVPAESLLRVGLVLLGLYLVVQAVPALLGLMTSPFVNWLQLRAETIYGDPGFADSSSWRWLIQSIPSVVSNLASLTFGSLLLAKREWIIARILGAHPVLSGAVEDTQACCGNCGASYDPADYEGGVVEPLCMNCKEPLDIPRT